MLPAHLQILQHSLGVNMYGQGNMYRNRFVAGSGNPDHVHCSALVEQGYMTCTKGFVLAGGSDLFVVTEAGIAAMLEASPKPPKLTRSQKRYKHWLNVADAYPDMKFIDWIKAGLYKVQ
jgi:hypothetical protein